MKKEKNFHQSSIRIHYFPHKSFHDTHIAAQVLPYTLLVLNASGASISSKEVSFFAERGGRGRET